jgi:hypothetical protein
MKEMKDWKINGTPRQVVENITLSIGARLMFVILRGYLGKNCNKPFPSYQALASKALLSWSLSSSLPHPRTSLFAWSPDFFRNN